MEESLFAKANEVAEVLGVSRAEAYRIPDYHFGSCSKLRCFF